MFESAEESADGPGFGVSACGGGQKKQQTQDKLLGKPASAPGTGQPDILGLVLPGHASHRYVPVMNTAAPANRSKTGLEKRCAMFPIKMPPRRSKAVLSTKPKPYVRRHAVAGISVPWACPCHRANRPTNAAQPHTGPRVAVASKSPRVSTDAKMPAWTKGNSTPLQLRTPPTVTMPRKIRGTNQRARPPNCAAHNPTAS